MSVYESLLEVPVDDYLGDDHDDQDVPAGEVDHVPAPRELSAALATTKPDPHVVVPFVYVKSGDSGPAVLAVVRALSRAGYGTWKGNLFSRKLGIFSTRNLNAFKVSHGFKPNGVYDKATWRELAPFFDAYSIKYLLNAATSKKPTREEKARNAFLAELMYLYNRRSLEAYTQARAYDRRKPPRGLDCSASGEWGAEHAGLKSLSGYSSFGYGNTDSQIARFRRLHGMRASIVVAEPGDPVYYGRGSDPSHVGFWLGGGRVWSFGAYPIKILPHDYRHDKIAVCDLMVGQ